MRLLTVRVCCTAVIAALVVVLLGGCGSRTAPVRATPVVAAPATAEPLQTVAVIEARAAPPTAVPGAPAATDPVVTPISRVTKPDVPRLGLGVAPDAPPAAIGPVLGALEAAGVGADPVTGQADLRLVIPGSDGAVAAWELVFTPVDRMSSLLESIALDELKAAWTGTGVSANFTSIYVGKDTAALLTPLLGRPGADVKPMPDDGVESAVWGDPMGLGVVPFDLLTVRLRAIKLDGRSPVDNRFQAAEWPMTARASLVGVTDRGRAALATAGSGLPVSNRDATRLTVLVMTGVTAMARNSAVAIERSGDNGFLARLVGQELAAADITTTSNEVPFFPDCVPDTTQDNILLCSKNEYWENLALSGVDAIGLSGNHLNDFGYEAMLGTLAFFQQKKIPTYGGGADEKTARAPLVFSQNKNRIGFLGANQYGPEEYWCATGEIVSAWAGPANPGAARFDLPTMQADIQPLKSRVDLVFAEVQHTEFNDAGDYQVEPLPQQVTDFRGLIDAGADVVTGIMAHAPQAVEIRDGKLILYGLGNLYFDQTWSWPTRTGLVARHTIYDGKLINTELLVTMIEDSFQLRWATPEERMQVLKSVFDVSRWE